MNENTVGSLLKPARGLWNKFIGSAHGKVFGAVTTIAVLTTFAKLASVAKELLVARRFGTGSTIEAYLIALLIPILAINVISNSLSIALIPTYVATKEKQGAEAAQRLLSGIIALSLLLLGLTTIALVASAPVYLPLIASGFNEKKLNLAFQLLLVIAPMIVISGVANIWGAVLNAGERFALVAVTPVVTPTVTVLVLLILRHTIFALPVGMVIGAALEMILLGIALRVRGISLRPSWHGINTQVREIAGQFSHRVGASLLRSGSAVVDRSLAATLPAGNVAALNYGNRITLTLLSVAGLALGTAITPHYSNLAALRDWEGLRKSLKRYSLVLLLSSIPIVVVLSYYATPLIQLIFQRGSFRTRDTQLVAQVHALYAFQIPFYLGNILVSRLLGSILASHVLVWGAALNLVLNVGLDLLLIRRMGISGIALSTSCASIITFCFFVYHGFRLLRAKEHVKVPAEAPEST